MIGGTIWSGPLPTADVMEKLWLEGKLPAGILPPLAIIKKYEKRDPDGEDKYIPDDTELYSGFY